jgi:KDO2-lipid IV(A) lauroyltransferase
MRCLKIDAASNLCGKIARKIGPILSVSNVARKNIHRGFPNFSKAQIEQVVINMWDNLGRTVAELPNIFLLNNEEFYKHVKVIGREHLDNIRKSGKSAILVTGHFANWELSTKVGCDAGLKLSFIYRKANNKLIDQQIIKIRQELDLIQIPKGKDGIKDILRSFKNNRCVCFLADQKLNSGISVPFFGIEAMTASAPAKLALDFKCPILPIQIIREKGTNLTVKIHSPIDINYDQNNSEEIYRITREINYIYEQWIQENPGQWFWLHKRWPKSFYE